MVTEQKVLTLIVTFKWKDLKIIIIQISTVKTNFNNKISAGTNSVRNAETIITRRMAISRQMPAKG